MGCHLDELVAGPIEGAELPDDLHIAVQCLLELVDLEGVGDVDEGRDQGLLLLPDERSGAHLHYALVRGDEALPVAADGQGELAAEHVRWGAPQETCGCRVGHQDAAVSTEDHDPGRCGLEREPVLVVRRTLGH